MRALQQVHARLQDEIVEIVPRNASAAIFIDLPKDQTAFAGGQRGVLKSMLEGTLSNQAFGVTRQPNLLVVILIPLRRPRWSRFELRGQAAQPFIDHRLATRRAACRWFNVCHI